MVNYHFLNIALDICMKIFEKAYPHVTGLEGGLMIESVDDSHGSASLILKQSDEETTFAVITVDVTELDIEKKKLIIEVIANKKEQELGGRHFGDFLVESIMKDFEALRPVVTEGIIHSMAAPDKPRRQVNRELEVRFRIFTHEFEADEDYMYGYDIDEIGKTAIPYVKALRDIHSKIYRK